MLMANATVELVMPVMEVVMASTDETDRIWDSESRQEIDPFKAVRTKPPKCEMLKIWKGIVHTQPVIMVMSSPQLTTRIRFSTVVITSSMV